MRRAARITILVLALPAAIVALLAALWIALNTDAGRRVAERAVHRFSSQRVTLSGLAGRFPDDLQLASLQVSDAAGPWLSVQDAVLRWSPLSLLTKRVRVAELSAARVVVVRAPHSDASSTSFRSLPKTVDVGALSIGRLELGEALAGTPATLALQGSARLHSLDDASLALEARRLDAAGTYHVRLAIVDGGVTGDLQLDEPGDGALAHLLQLPGLGAWHADGRIAGPRGAEAVDLQLMAGSLQSRVRGTLDWTRHSADVVLSAHSAAMAPRADLRWDRLDLDGRWRGTLATANANADFALQGVVAGTVGVQALMATLNSVSGRVTLRASAAGVRLPGAHPDLLRNAPVRVTADLDLNTQPRAIRYTLEHDLLQARGSARLAEPLQADATVRIPSLAPLAELAGVAMRGAGELQLRFSGNGTTGRIEGSGSVGVTGGAPTLVALAGPSTSLRARVGWDRGRLRIDEARIAGAAIDASVQGGRSVRQAWSLQWQVALPRLAALDAAAEGSADAHGSVDGTEDALQGTALLHADASFHGSPRGPLEVRVAGRDLLTTPALTLSGQGSLDAAPLVVAATVQRDASRSWRIRVPRGEWKSARLTGDLTLPAQTAASQTRAAGQLTLQIAQLEDLQSLAGMPLSGSLDASLRAAGDNRLSLRASAANVHAQAVDADLRLAADGALDALAVQANATVRGLPDGDVQFVANGLVDVPSRRVRLDALEALYRKQVVRLRQPARIDLGDAMRVQGLQLSVGSGVVALDGQLTPTLDAQATVRGLDAAELAKWLPAGSSDAAPTAGRLSADASLQGTPQSPRGVLQVRATGLRWRNGVAEGLPALDVDGHVDLRGESAPQLTLQLTGGSRAHVSVDGELPRTADGILALRVSGTVDASLANGFLEASGRRAAGQIVLDGRIAGTRQSPQISGRATLSNGDLRDYAAGVHVGAITAELEARRDELVLTRFDAHAGTGTLQASGSIGVLQPGVPVALHLTAHDAQPIDGQLLRARMDADLTLDGEFQGQLRLAGRISASRAEITIPGTLPTSVPTLDVRRPGHAAPMVDSTAARPLAIDVTIEAPRAVFVRGRGLDAEVGGEVRWRGTRAAPLVSGGFELRSGRFNLAGKALEFQSGRVSFNGRGTANQLDPTLDFVASNTSGGVTSTLKVGGYADAPVLTLSSSPEQPQDEVLARLLFGASITELSALQLAQMGAAVATLGGVGGGGGPLLSLQRSLGLDRLAISGAQGAGTGASIEAGRYVSRRVYVGTRQNTAGGTQGEVEVDLSQRLKMRAAFGAGAGSSTTSAQGSTPTDQAGSTVGLSYELEF